MNIEELAFKDRKALVNLNEIDLLNIIELLQDDRKQWINQFSKTHNESIEIQKENKQLKERIEYLERSNNRREDTILEQRQEISNLEDNRNKLKKWIDIEIENRDSEDLLKLYVELQEDNETLLSRIRGYKSQQKEFIKYLEKKINISRNTEPFFVENIFSSYDLTELELNMLQEILQKYKEIVGCDN